jgi:hypothetical protein
VKLQERFDLETEEGVVAAGLGEKGFAFVERQLESRQKQVFGPLR